jgi:chitinase
VDSTALYDKCTWAAQPNCDKGQCTGSKSTVIALSTSGSGGSICDGRTWTDAIGQFGPKDAYQQRKYCCDQSDSKKTWEDCQWFDSYQGLVPKASLNNWCASGCPPDRVRIAMDKDGDQCRNKAGARAKCCTVGYKTIKKRSQLLQEEYASSLAEWISSGTCTSTGGLTKRLEVDLDRFATNNTMSFFHRRAASSNARSMTLELLGIILLSTKPGRSNYPTFAHPELYL